VSAPGRTEPRGVLHGVRVVELASEHGAFAGKMLADLGAEVIVV
jgi:crotonobetainyl-CoA:carnitine CoA-transferase CaiB-like acyl-CoA transferase